MTYATARDSVRLAPVSNVAWQQVGPVRAAAAPAATYRPTAITPSSALEIVLLVATLCGLSVVLGSVIAGIF